MLKYLPNINAPEDIRDFTREELFENFPGARTFPQIRIDGEAIGGYDNFVSWTEGQRVSHS